MKLINEENHNNDESVGYVINLTCGVSQVFDGNDIFISMFQLQNTWNELHIVVLMFS